MWWMGAHGAGGPAWSGVRFGTYAGGRWKPPALEPWEELVADPTQPMVWHPEVLRQWGEDKKRCGSGKRWANWPKARQRLWRSPL